MNIILLSILLIGGIGCIGAIVLYFVSQKFEVYEDPRIGAVTDLLPAANCGGCGYPGCSGFATACVCSENLDQLHCPVGGDKTMEEIARLLGKSAVSSEPQIAVVRCNGSCSSRQKTSIYDGAVSCRIASALYSGDTGCSFGCLGMGDCVRICRFGAIQINPETELPEVDEEKCTACGACVKACPKLLIQLRKKGPKSRYIYVGCMNKEKGGLAKKACGAACIACSKCLKVCSFDAITIENNLAYINDEICRLCRKCVDECPTAAIIASNFPPRKSDSENIKSTEVLHPDKKC